MTAQHIWTALSSVAFVLACWQWAEDRRCRRLRDRVSGLDRQRWDRLVPVADRPEITIEPTARDAAKRLLELAIDGSQEDLAGRCRTTAGEELTGALGVCRLVSGYLLIDQCPPWPISDERLRRAAARIRDALLPTEITSREIRDCLGDALGGLRPRGAEGRLPGSPFPEENEAVVTLLVTSRLLVRCRPDGCAPLAYLDWLCDLLNAFGDASLHLIPALIQHAPASGGRVRGLTKG